MKDEYVIWKYVEKKPLPSYLVSVVVGKFSQYESKYRDFPSTITGQRKSRKEDAMLTFSETPQMVKFFEEYFDTNYPFKNTLRARLIILNLEVWKIPPVLP